MRLFVPCPYLRASVLSSYYILDRRTAPSDRTAPKFGTHVRIVSLTLKKKFDPPHPGGWLCGWQLYTFRGLPIHCACVRLFVPCPYLRASVLSSYYILDRRTAPSDRTAPKFGTHVRIVSLTLKKKFDPPHPGGWLCGWQLYTFHLLISGHDRRTEPKFGSHVRIDTPTLKKN